MFLTRDQIRTLDDRQYEDVDVPEWGGQVKVRSLTGRERDAFERTLINEKKNGQRESNLENFRARLAILAVVDADTKELMFTDRDAKWLGDKSAGALQRIVEVANRLSGLTPEDVEELVEDFDEGPSIDSGSD